MNRPSFLSQLAEAKQRLPLRRLMQRIGDDKYTKPSALCPFHDDTRPSFSLFETRDGGQLWKCHTGCGTGDGVAYLQKRFGLSTGEAMRRYIKEAGLDDQNGHEVEANDSSGTLAPAKPPPANGSERFDWDACVQAFLPAAVDGLANWRKLSVSFVEWLRREKIVGLHRNKLAIAVHDSAGNVVSCHLLIDREKRSWIYHPKGHGTHPLVIGDVAAAGTVMVFESQWDAFAIMDKLGWHEAGGLSGCAVVITRGAENGKLTQRLCPAIATAYAFVQNDPPREAGPPAAEKWLADVVEHIGCPVFRVDTPLPHKDPNDWTRSGATREQIDAAMRSAALVPWIRPANAESRPDEDKLKAWVRGEIIAVYCSEVSMNVKRARISERVVEALEKLGAFYCHEHLKDFSTSMFFNGHRKRLDRVSSDSFIAWLSEWISINRADVTFKFVRTAVDNAALSGKKTKAIVPEAYWASRPCACYMSCGDGQVMKITGEGVKIVDNGTDGVLFAAGKTMAPWKLTAPRSAFESCSLFRDVQCSADHGRDLLMIWLYSLPTNPRNKPPLCLAGEIGSGKTRFAQGIAELFGIPFQANAVEDEGEKDFWTAINVGGMVTLDNADTRCRWLPDALATASTGGSCQRRRLYKDDEIMTMAPKAWIAITTAEALFANDPGLADRLQVVRMRRRTGKTSDSALTAEIMAVRDAALSDIANAIRAALADSAPTPECLNRRHPDFAAFGVKIGRALGREAEAIAALSIAEADKSSFCLENHPIAAALLSYLKQSGEFEGTAAELLPKLKEIDADLERYSAKRLGKHLSKIWPHLEAGLGCAEKEVDRKGITVFRFKAPGLPGLES